MACPRSRGAAARAHARGVALVAVLWIVSALALAAASLAAAMRTDLRLLQRLASEAQAAALGDAAIRLAAFELLASAQPGGEVLSGEFHLGGRRVRYDAWPATGFVNLNTAPETLLRDLLVHAGGLAPASATHLARRIVAWRTPEPAAADEAAEEAPGAGVAGPRRRTFFAVPEDLLQVPGVDLELFAGIRSSVSVHGSRSGGVDALVARPEVLAVLARGDEALAHRIASARAGEGRLMEVAGLEPTHLGDGAQGSTFRIEARVSDEDGPELLRAHWIALGAHDRLPWRTIAVEPVVAATGLHAR